MRLGAGQLRSSFFWDMVSHCWLIGVQHLEKVWIFGPTTLLRNVTHHSPSDESPHSRSMKTPRFLCFKSRTFLSLNGENHEQAVKLNNYLHTFA